VRLISDKESRSQFDAGNAVAFGSDGIGSIAEAVLKLNLFDSVEIDVVT